MELSIEDIKGLIGDMVLAQLRMSKELKAAQDKLQEQAPKQEVTKTASK